MAYPNFDAYYYYYLPPTGPAYNYNGTPTPAYGHYAYPEYAHPYSNQYPVPSNFPPRPIPAHIMGRRTPHPNQVSLPPLSPTGPFSTVPMTTSPLRLQSRPSLDICLSYLSFNPPSLDMVKYLHPEYTMDPHGKHVDEEKNEELYNKDIVVDAIAQNIAVWGAMERVPEALILKICEYLRYEDWSDDLRVFDQVVRRLDQFKKMRVEAEKAEAETTAAEAAKATQAPKKAYPHPYWKKKKDGVHWGKREHIREQKERTKIQERREKKARAMAMMAEQNGENGEAGPSVAVASPTRRNINAVLANRHFYHGIPVSSVSRAGLSWNEMSAQDPGVVTGHVAPSIAQPISSPPPIRQVPAVDLEAGRQILLAMLKIDPAQGDNGLFATNQPAPDKTQDGDEPAEPITRAQTPRPHDHLIAVPRSLEKKRASP
jgi:hypothetical protein